MSTSSETLATNSDSHDARTWINGFIAELKPSAYLYKVTHGDKREDVFVMKLYQEESPRRRGDHKAGQPGCFLSAGRWRLRFQFSCGRTARVQLATVVPSLCANDHTSFGWHIRRCPIISSRSSRASGCSSAFSDRSNPDTDTVQDFRGTYFMCPVIIFNFKRVV